MRILYDGCEVGSVVANHGMTKHEILECAFRLRSVDDEERLEELYDDGCDFVYRDDQGYHCLDIDALEIVDD